MHAVTTVVTNLKECLRKVRVPHLLVQYDCYMPETKLLNTEAQEKIDIPVENPPSFKKCHDS